MTLLDHAILTFCGLGFAGIIGYAFWIKVRVLDLQADLYICLTELSEQATKLGLTADPAYQQARKNLLAVWAFAPSLSLPAVLCLIWIIRGRQQKSLLQSENPQLQAAIDSAIADVSLRTVRYLLNETITGKVVSLFMQFFARFLPGMIVKREAKQAVEDMYRKGAFLGA